MLIFVIYDFLYICIAYFTHSRMVILEIFCKLHRLSLIVISLECVLAECNRCLLW